MKPKSILLTAIASLLAISPSHGAPISWIAGTAGDANGAWDGPATFNGQAYTAADELFVDGAAAKIITLSGTITDPLSLNVSSSGATTLTGSSVGGPLFKTGAGALTLASANTFGNVSIAGGKFVLTNAAGLGTTGILTVNAGTASGVLGSYGAPGATFFYDSGTLSSSYTLFKNITFGTVGANTTYGMAMQTGSAATPLATTLSGNLTGASNITVWLDVRTSATPNFSTWVLSGDNSDYAGNFRLNRGNVQFNSLAAMGTGAVFIQTNGSDGAGTNPSNLTFGFGGTVSNPITLRAGSGTAVSLSTGANNVTLSNTLTLSGDATTGASGTFNKLGSGTLTVTGTLETVERVNGTVTATSPLTVGGLDAGNVSANLREGTLDVSGMIGSTLTLNTLIGAAGTTLSIGAKSLSISGAASGTFSGTLSGTGGTLTKTGTGAVTLAGSNSFTGGTIISQGTVGVGNNAGLGTGAVTVNASAAYGAGYLTGGTPFLRSSATGLAVANDIALPASAGYYALQSGTAAGGSVEWSGIISGGGAGVVLQIDTPNPADSTSTITLTGNNTFSGQIRLNRGRLVLNQANALGTASLFLQSNQNITDGNVAFSGPAVLTNDVLIGTTANQAITTANGDVVLSGIVANNAGNTGGGIAKLGAGTLFLANGGNALAGPTTVSAGTLAVAGAGRLNAAGYGGALSIGAGATFEYASSADQIVSGAISGAGNLAKGGSSVLTLSNLTNSYFGTTTVEEGTLFVSGGITATSTLVNSAGTLAGTGTIGGPTVVNGTLQGGDGSTVTTLTFTGDLTLNSTSAIKLALGASGAHSALALNGLETFDPTQDFNFLDLAAAPGIYASLITGITSDPGTLGGWQILNPGWAGAFEYNAGAQAIDLNLAAVPEPSAVFSLLGGIGVLAGLRRRRH